MKHTRKKNYRDRKIYRKKHAKNCKNHGGCAWCRNSKLRYVRFGKILDNESSSNSD